jgi:hypothetical protein
MHVMSHNHPPVTTIRHPLLDSIQTPVDTANRSSGPLYLMTRLSAWPKRPGRAPPGVPVGGNRAVDAAFPIGRGLFRIEDAVAAGRHTDLFTAQEISRFCRPGFGKAHPAGASSGLNARGLPQSTALSPRYPGPMAMPKTPTADGRGHALSAKQGCPRAGFQARAHSGPRCSVFFVRRPSPPWSVDPLHHVDAPRG